MKNFPLFTLIVFLSLSCTQETAQIYTMNNGNGMEVKVTNYGARITSIVVPAANGLPTEVVWGYDTVQEYYNSSDINCGPIVGRYGNRIGKGEFTLDGTTYHLSLNDGKNHLHGGTNGFSSKLWKATQLSNYKVKMEYLSKDGEEGYPGNLKVAVTYSLLPDNKLEISYEATTDAPTIINLTSHAYFNLHGTSAHTTNTHILTINADSFTPVDSELIPTGAIIPVEGTPLDFRIPTAIGDRINTLDYEQIAFAGGYDHNWVLNKPSGNPKAMTFAAELYEPSTGITMRVMTDQKGLQFYSGNFMDGKDVGRNGDRHSYRTGVALETQNFPDAPNHFMFPSPVLRPGETYSTTTYYSFDTK
ncbi:MAG: galactose mutarotase [Bacteroidales bacterium]|nr:galactose mutarotase [Bacteroidales bacterium]MDD3200520.1 galactose mutarotase [Bacteroidales bacterium]